MTYQKADFSPFSVDAGRVIANLETAYEQVLETERALAAMPSSMYWQNKSGTDYLAQKRGPGDSGSTVGVRSPETEQRMTQYADECLRLRDRQSSLNTLLVDRARQYRALRLPQVLEPQARLLRELDARQGRVLLDAARYFLKDSYPLDVDFVLNLPSELREHFTEWAEASGFDPMKPA